MYSEFIEVYFSKDPKDSPGFAFKAFLKDGIENICTDEFKRKKQEDALLNREANDKDLDKIEIAEITFAFNNSKLIKLLRKRGTAIINQQFNKQKKIEKEIMKLKKEDYDALTVPVCAFITF